MKFDPEGNTPLECFLGPLESRVMELVWGWPNNPRGWPVEMIVRSLQREEGEYRTYTTFSSVIYRLIKKGLLLRVTSKKNSPQFVRVRLSEREFYEMNTTRILGRLFDEFPSIVRLYYESRVGAEVRERFESVVGK